MPPNDASGGSRANRTGRLLENFVENLLRDFDYVRQGKTRQLRNALPEARVYWRQYPVGKGIYETEVKVDFLIYNPEVHDIGGPRIIETKWQQVGGSVDEKFPYLVQNIRTRYPHKTLVLIDGDGFKDGAKKWLRRQQGGNLERVFLSMGEFQAYANNGHL